MYNVFMTSITLKPKANEDISSGGRRGRLRENKVFYESRLKSS